MHTTQRLKKRQYHAPLLNLINLRGRDPLALDDDEGGVSGGDLVTGSLQNEEAETRRRYDSQSVDGGSLWGGSSAGTSGSSTLWGK